MISNISYSQCVSPQTFKNNSDDFLGLSRSVSGSINSVRNYSDVDINKNPDSIRNVMPNKETLSYYHLMPNDVIDNLSLAESRSLSFKDYGAYEKRRMMFVKAMTHWFLTEKKEDIIQALKTLHIDKKPNADNVTTIGAAYYPSKNMKSQKWCGRVLETFKKHVIKLSGDCNIIKGFGMTVTTSDYPGKYYEINLDITNEKLNKKTIGLIFESLYHVYTATHGSDRFLLASSASSLRNYWCHHLPNGMNKNDILNEASYHPDFFETGNVIIEILLRDWLYYMISQRKNYSGGDVE